MRRIDGHDRMVIAAFEAGTADTDRQVRALCEVALLERRNPEGVRLGTALLPFIEGDDGALREAALATLPRRATRTPEVCEALRHSLRHADLATRLAALRVITTMRVRALLPDVGALFNDPRTAPIAISQLTEWGDEALGAVSVPVLGRPDSGDPADDAAPSTVAPSMMLSSAESSEDAPISRLLSHADAGVRDRATRALGDMVRGGRHRPLPRQIVEPLLEREIGLAYGLHAIIAGIQAFPATSDSDPADVSFLRRELELRVRTGRHRILQLLSLLASRKLVRVIEAGLRRETPNRDAQVAELLEMTLKPALARKVVPLFDRISTRERLEAAASLGLAQPAALADPLDAILALDDAHIRGCAMIVYGPRFAERAPSVFDAESALIPLFERMRFLRSVPLFAELSGDDLRMVGEILEQVEYDADDPVFHKGDPGEDLFLVLRGRVAIRDGTKELAMLREREFFGELAGLDREPRSADAVCAEDTSLLRLRSADLGELMARRPQIQEGIMIVLVRKIRALNQRLSL